MTLEEAIAEAKAGSARNWGGIDLNPVVSGTILQAAISGDLIPKADHRLAVAAAYQRAANADWARGMDIKDTAPDFLSDWQRGLVAGIAAFRDAILALAPADPLAEVQALKADLAAEEAAGVSQTKGFRMLLDDANARVEVAEAEVQALKSTVQGLRAAATRIIVAEGEVKGELQRSAEAAEAEVARLREALTILGNQFEYGHLWAGDSRSDVIRGVEKIARAALQPKAAP